MKEIKHLHKKDLDNLLEYRSKYLSLMKIPFCNCPLCLKTYGERDGFYDEDKT